ncbi:hypothetical protein ACROYT_G042091 [Oculina patagonica]
MWEPLNVNSRWHGGVCDACSTNKKPVPERGWGEVPVQVRDRCFGKSSTVEIQPQPACDLSDLSDALEEETPQEILLEKSRRSSNRLCYPEEFVQSTIRQFIESKVSEGAPTQQNDLEKQDPIRIVLPFKDQKSANSVRRQLGDLSRKIKVDISPVYTSRKIKDEIKVREDKPPLVNQQCVVYNFQCNLCDAGYVGYTCRHLHQRIEEHKGSAIGNHLKEQHGMAPNDIAQFFRILKKCQSKFDCLIYEMFFIKELKPTLNKQCDSIRAKLFV